MGLIYAQQTLSIRSWPNAHARLDFLRRDVFPLIECASLSRPPTEDEQASMGGLPDWEITGYTAMRRTLSNRILVRSACRPNRCSVSGFERGWRGTAGATGPNGRVLDTRHLGLAITTQSLENR
jgi:hypothetical protein